MSEPSGDTYITITAMVCGTVILLAGLPYGQGLISLALGIYLGRVAQ